MKIEDYKEEVIKKALLYKDAFDTPAGQEVLKDLTARYYDVELFNVDAIAMAGNVAARDVVAHILSLIKVAEK